MAIELTKADLLKTATAGATGTGIPSVAPTPFGFEGILQFMNSLERMAQYSLNLLGHLQQIKNNPELKGILQNKINKAQQHNPQNINPANPNPSPAVTPDFIFLKFVEALTYCKGFFGDLTISQLLPKLEEHKVIIVSALEKTMTPQGEAK
jgi:hypothetical protein